MTSSSSIPEAERLAARLQQLAGEKAALHLVLRLIQQLNPLSSFDNLLRDFIGSIMNTIGGTNIKLYCWEADKLHYLDFLGENRIAAEIEDPLALKVLELRSFVELERGTQDPMLVDAAIPDACSWGFPLQVGEELIGIVIIENLHVSSHSLGKHLPAFFDHAALILSNELRQRIREHTERALMASEARSHSMLEAAMDAVWLLDGQTAFLDVNQAACQMLGYSKEELLRLKVSGVEDAGSTGDFLRRLDRIASKGSDLFESFHLKKNGSRFPVEISVAHLADQQQFVAFVRDITGRKQGEAFKESTQEILKILTGPGEFRDSIHRVISVLKTLTGFEAAGIRLEDGEDFPYLAQNGFPDDFLIAENSLLERVAGGGVCRGPDGKVCLECTCGLIVTGQTNPANPLFTLGGSAWTNDAFPLLEIPLDQDPRHNPRNQCIHHGYASIALVPIRARGRIVGLIQINDHRKDLLTLDLVEHLEGIASLVGEALVRRWAEDALARAAREWSAVMDASEDAISLLDLDLRIIRANRAFYQATGTTPEAALGHLNAEIMHPRGLPDHCPVCLAQTEKRDLQMILEQDHPANALGRPIEVVLKVIRDPDGRPTSLFMTLHDLSAARKQMEEKAALERRLQQAQKLESLGILAGGVAHDMNNVLGAILGLASANMKHAPEDSSSLRAFETIAMAAERGGKMVKSLLSFARRSPVEEQELNVNAILQEVINLLERTTLSRIRLDLDLAPDLRPILGDGSALTHAFMNLCVNAADAMRESGILTLRTRNLEHAQIEVQIQDTGAGMSKEIMGKALEPFFTTKPDGKGTGLGLSMAYGTVKAHRGEMEIQSEPGAGTIVSMRFPALGAMEEPVKPEAAPEQESTSPSLDVLLVDDDELIQLSIQEVLKVLGHRVTPAMSGEEALAKLEAGLEPDVVILDMNMPGLGGRGTLPRLRALRPELPVLLATGRVDQLVLDLERDHPFVTLLSKPFSLDELGKRLKDIPVQRS